MVEKNKTTPGDNITGLILAGGAGRRAGNRDKGTIEWQGEPMATQVSQRLRPQVSNLIISCNRNLPFYQQLADDTVTDRRGDYQGPLAGLEAAHPRINSEFILLAPCDAPLLPRDLAERLLPPLLQSDDLQVSFARCGDDNHYLFAVLRSTSLNSLTEYLDEGGRAVRHWYSQCGAIAVDFDDEPGAFLNINRPD